VSHPTSNPHDLHEKHFDQASSVLAHLRLSSSCYSLFVSKNIADKSADSTREYLQVDSRAHHVAKNSFFLAETVNSQSSFIQQIDYKIVNGAKRIEGRLQIALAAHRDAQSFAFESVTRGFAFAAASRDSLTTFANLARRYSITCRFRDKL
jgi:hypothetical protein